LGFTCALLIPDHNTLLVGFYAIDLDAHMNIKALLGKNLFGFFCDSFITCAQEAWQGLEDRNL